VRLALLARDFLGFLGLGLLVLVGRLDRRSPLALGRAVLLLGLLLLLFAHGITFRLGEGRAPLR